MTDTPTPEEIAQHYTAMGHSVDLINAGQPVNMSDEDWADTVSRNVEHLKLMVAKTSGQPKTLLRPMRLRKRREWHNDHHKHLDDPHLRTRHRNRRD
jgi:hypothetical protein